MKPGKNKLNFENKISNRLDQVFQNFSDRFKIFEKNFEKILFSHH